MENGNDINRIKVNYQDIKNDNNFSNNKNKNYNSSINYNTIENFEIEFFSKKNDVINIGDINLNKLAASKNDAINGRFLSKNNIFYEYYLENNADLKYEVQSDGKSVLISDEKGTPLWWSTVDALNTNTTKNKNITTNNKQVTTSNINTNTNNKQVTTSNNSIDKNATISKNKERKEYGSFEGSIKYYNQGIGWGSFGGYGPIASIGCGPTAIAIVISSLTGKSVTPDDVSAYMSEHGMCSSDGATWSDIEKIEKHFADMYSTNDKKYYTKSISDLDELKNVLASGNAMAVTIEETNHVAGGLTLSNGATIPYDGHYIVLSGVKDNGSSDDYDVIVYDPASSSNNGASVSVNAVAEGSANSSDAPSFWVVSTEPFD